MRKCEHSVEFVLDESPYCKDCGETDLQSWEYVMLKRDEAYKIINNGVRYSGWTSKNIVENIMRNLFGER